MSKRKIVLKESKGDGEQKNDEFASVDETFISDVIKSLNKRIDASAFMLGEDASPSDVKYWLSTGSTTLDMNISNNVEADGGIPVGRLTEICGESQCVTEDTIVEIIVEKSLISEKATIANVKELIAQNKKVKVKSINDEFVDVIDYIEKGMHDTYNIILSNGYQTKASEKHLFFTNAGWVTVKQLVVNGHSILCDDTSYAIVSKIDYIGKHKIVDITVDHPGHCYFTNGMLSHNTGKSLMAYMILADCVRKGGIAVLIDTENAANVSFMRLQGLEPNVNLIYSQVDTVEDVFNAIEVIIEKIKANNKDQMIAIVWDSVAATSTSVEMEEEIGQSGTQYSPVPKLIRQGLRRIKRLIGDQKVALIFLNQLITKIGMSFGDPMYAPGGTAIPFFADVRLRLYSAGKIKSKDNIIGVNTRVKVVKTRFGPPFCESKLNIYFSKGLIDEEGWKDVLIKHGIIVEPSKFSTNAEMTIDGQKMEFKKREFAQFISSLDNDMYNKIKLIVKQCLYSDQKGDEANIDATIEEFTQDERI